MKLEDIQVDMLQTAMDIYLRCAYSRSSPPLTVEIPEGEGLRIALAEYVDDTMVDGQASACRYVFRLGSEEYPFMKLVLQEYLLENQFFLMVDTHDELELKPGMPDYDAWNELKVRNRELKLEIERKWEEAKLPTLADLKQIAEMIPVGEPVGSGREILIVDDEMPLADSLGALLERKGYRVITTYDGRDALEKLDHCKPDLIVMDYEMPRLDGMELCTLLRASKQTEHIPVLLATASTVDLQEVMKLANGFLVKPYQKEILFDCIDHLMP